MTKPSVSREEITKDLVAALQKIAGGFIDRTILLERDPADWQDAFSQLQNIASDAIAAEMQVRAIEGEDTARELADNDQFGVRAKQMTQLHLRDFTILRYAQGFTHWLLRHNGPLSDTLAPGFWDEADGVRLTATSGQSKPWVENGDLVTIRAADATAIRQFRRRELKLTAEPLA